MPPFKQQSTGVKQLKREYNLFSYYHRPQTTQYNNIISDLTRCLVIIPKWAGLAPWCCVNECFFV